MIKKPERLSDEKRRQIPKGFHYLLEYKEELDWLLQAQNDYCYKEMLGQIISSLNMRDVGGIEPEWAMSNKDYQALQLEEA